VSVVVRPGSADAGSDNPYIAYECLIWNSYAASAKIADELVQEIEGTGRRALAVKVDQAIQAEVAALVRTAHEAFGKLDILVNSAGVFVTGMVDDAQADLAAFDHQIDINVKALPPLSVPRYR
jgi:3-oxoacyl-[acyl-carrier protein] reductase